MPLYNSIFIVGTGRSGTHYLCKSLLDFQNIDDNRSGKENFKILHSIACSAISNCVINKDVINYYQTQIDISTKNKNIFLDQCHPNLYHYNQLSLKFNSLFLGIDRPTEQIVASMINHKGTSRWYSRLKNDYPKNVNYPNSFFGLETKSELYNLPQHLLYAKRVIAHKKINQELLKYDNFKLIDFENLISNKLQEFKKIFSNNQFSSFGQFNETEFSNPNVLFKYRDTLSSKQIEEIKKLEKNENC